MLQTGTADQEDRIERSSLESQTSEVVPFETIDGTSLHEGSDVDDLSLEHSSLKLYFECEIFEQDSECLEVMTKVRMQCTVHTVHMYCGYEVVVVLGFLID